MKTFHFVAGLPRSGSTLLINLFKQNPLIHGQAVSSLSTALFGLAHNWDTWPAHLEQPDYLAKEGALRGLLHGYYSHINKDIIIDKDRGWVTHIALIEQLLQRPVKIIVCVRNPAEILSSFEKLRKKNTMFTLLVDQQLREMSNVPTRAEWFMADSGPIGMSYNGIYDAIIQGYQDRMLFVEYNRFCNTPRKQMQRIYDFLELPVFGHDFDNIKQDDVYNDVGVGYPGLHKIKSSLEKTTVNCVEYLGLELYERYNKNIFWSAWV